MYFSVKACIILSRSVSPIYESFLIFPSEPGKLFVLPDGWMRGEACFHPQLETLLPFLPCSVALRWQRLLQHRLCILWIIYTCVKMLCSNIWWSSKKRICSQILHYQLSLKTRKGTAVFPHMFLDNTVQVVSQIYTQGIFKQYILHPSEC